MITVPMSNTVRFKFYDALGQPIYIDCPNSATTEGVNHLLDVGFGNATQNANWFFGIISGSGFTATAITDTMASHSGWTEDTQYNSAIRPQWNDAAASSRAKASSSSSTFTMSNATSIRGVFLASNSQKGGTSGVLWCTSLLPATRSLASGEQWEIETYRIRIPG